MQRLQAVGGRAAQRLAVDGDVRDADQAGDVLQPSHAAAFEGARVERGEDPFEGVMRRYTARQAQEASEPTLAFPGKQRDVGPVIAVGNHAAERHDDDVDQPMLRPADDARILERAEVFPDQTHASRSSHAILRVLSRTPKNCRAVHLSESTSTRQLGWILMRSPWGGERTSYAESTHPVGDI